MAWGYTNPRSIPSSNLTRSYPLGEIKIFSDHRHSIVKVWNQLMMSVMSIGDYVLREKMTTIFHDRDE